MREVTSLVCTIITLIALLVAYQPAAMGKALVTTAEIESQTALVTFFGPEVFTRQKGTPITVTRSISTSGYEEPFVFHLRNGDANGKFRVSSATVSLNDRVLFRESQFSQQRSGYDLRLEIPNGSILKVRLEGAPGSKLTIWIEGSPLITPVLDLSHTVEKVIDGNGGSITATSAAGVKIQLTVPKLALVNPTKIRITPITSIYDMPWKGLFVCGVQLEPEGLRFASPVELTLNPPDSFPHGKYLLGFAYRGQGARSHLYPAMKDNATLKLSVFHFSGYGVVTTDSDADLTASLSALRNTADGLEQAEAIILATAEARGGLTGDDMAALAELCGQYYQSVILPALNDFYACVDSDCPSYEELADIVVSGLEVTACWPLPYYVRVQVLEKIQSIFPQMASALTPMWQRWNDECAGVTDCTLYREEIDSILALAETIVELGGTVDLASACGGRLPFTVTAANISPMDPTMKVGTTLQLQVAITMGCNVPSDATVEWESQFPDVATVDGLTGFVTALGKGTTPIVAKVSQCDTTYFNVITLTVTADIQFSGSVDVVGGNGVEYVLDVSGSMSADTGTGVGMVSGFVIYLYPPPNVLPNMPGGRFAVSAGGMLLLVRNKDGTVTGTSDGFPAMTFSGTLEPTALIGVVTVTSAGFSFPIS